MYFYPFEITTPHVVYTCLGGFIVLFGMFSLFLREKLYIGEAIWAFVFGVIIGPYGGNVFNPRAWGDGSPEIANEITLEFTRVVLAIGVFAIGVELPKAYMARHWKSLFFLLVPVMTWGWFISAALIYALIPPLNFVSSLAVAACLTPTDPILAAAIVGGKYADKHVPAHIRHLLAAESGCNDGAAFPFLYIALYLIIDTPNTEHAIRDWFVILWLYQIILGTAIGVALGFGFRHMMKFCERHDLIDRHSYVAQYVSLAMLTIGVTTLLGSDDLLSAFACGAAFAWDGFFNRQTEETSFSSVIDLLFNIAAFVYVGAWMPFDDFVNKDTGLEIWRLIVIALLILLLRRLPIMIALYRWIPDVKTFREAVFSGHFGPIGIGAVFISTLAAEVLDKNHTENTPHKYEVLAESIQPIVAFMVLCSITVHGLSIPGFSLGRRVHSVSRTWSRRDVSMGPQGGGAEWTNMVRRGDEGIVVNRDPERDLERGTATDEEKVVESSERSTPEKEETRHVTLPPPTGLERDEDVGGDGMTVISEWQEGPHRIIERRSGPGEEIEVEVIRNSEDPTYARSHTLRGTEAAVKAHIGRFLGRTEEQVKTTEGTVVKDVHLVEEKAKDDAERVIHTVTSPSPSTSKPPSPTPASDEEDEGWVSDSSTTPEQRQGRRASRSKHHSHGRKKTQNLRIRVLQSERRESPARSIRFADQGEGSPRTSIYGESAPESSGNGIPGKVTFDLPDPK